MWILKNSNTLLETLNSRSRYVCNSIKTFDFSTLLTTIPHTQLTSRTKELIQRCFSNKNGEQSYQCLVICRYKSYFVKSHSISTCNDEYYRTISFKCDIFFMDNIFVQFGGRMFHQTIGIPVGTNCAPLFVSTCLSSILPSRVSQE
jgi:hypothetical protein